MDAQGAVDSLVGRLATILVDEAQLLGGLRGDVEFIKDEMESMNSLLLHLTESQHRSHQIRTWMKHVVGLTRDCEGNVELYVRYVAGADPRGNKGLLGYLRRILQLLRTVPARHRVATRIRELKVRARDVGDRRLRYGVTVPPALPEQGRTIADKPAPQPGGPEEEEDLRRRELLVYRELPDTVEEGTNKVLDWLLRDYEQDIVHIGITGAPGTGKTVIATKVYEHPSVVSAYEYRAWINFGRLERGYFELWREIAQQLFMVSLEDTETWLKQEFSEHLAGKKCLIFFDGVPDSSPDYFRGVDVGIRVVMTSRQWCPRQDHTYWCEIRPIFFRGRALALATCEHSPIADVLEGCYHDVFAMQMLLRLLYVNPQRSMTEMKSLSRALADNRNTTAKVMLMFCYNELPTNYKSCLLYLSIFPQDHIIRRTDLLRRWVAEGLITKRSVGMTTLDDQAERIFDSLVTRGFILPEETSDACKIKSCKVHHIVHEFITTDVGLVDTLSQPDLAHRFSINGGVALQEESPESDHPGHGILTLLESLPGSAQWQLLKVLDLEGCKGLKKKHLNSICKILLLKYLSLRNTDVTELPKQIEKLQCLQTLDIQQTMVRAFATKSVTLPMLKHLLAGQKEYPSNNSDKFQESFATVHIPSGIRRMKKLEILSHVDVSHHVDDVSDIGKLLQLRKLGVVLHGKKGSLSVLFQQIEKLHVCLRSLSIRINQPTASEGKMSSPPRFLRSLNISGITSELPLWIAELDQLTKITLSETELGEDALCILGRLRILRCLRLRHKSYTESELKFKEGEFKGLKSLVVKGSNITKITFDTGAAPNLEMIVWSFASMEILSGLNHLAKLKKLELNGDCNTDLVRKEIEEHPNHPDFKHNGRLLHQEAERMVGAV